MIGWLLALVISTASAEPSAVEAAGLCLDQQDVPCAEEVARREGMADSGDPVVLAMAAKIAYSAGKYPEALELMDAAIEAGWEDRFERRALFERTLFATADWVEVERGRFRIRYREGVDAILVEEAARALERTDRFVTPLLGSVPPGSTIVELFPDGRSFIASSSLTKDDVESTGVVALSKWSRLLVSSPRALGRGYDWQSTLSHEYIHLVVAHNTTDRAPVWLQEAIAKYLDNRWEEGADRYHLSVRLQGYLAGALAEDDLVPFSEMHPSLAKIKVFDEDGNIDTGASSRRSAQAYAQLSTLMQFCFQTAGEGVLVEALPRVKAGIDPRIALAEAAGFADFDALLVAWEAHVRSLDLIEKRLEALPTVLDGGADADLDPVFAKRKDLANYLRLGDLLYGRDHYRASLLEYEKATDEDDPNSPLLANRIARAHIALDDRRAARRTLLHTLADYPQFPMTHKALGALHRGDGDLPEAIASLAKAAALNPFDADVQIALMEVYKETGASDRAREREAIVRILRRGGGDEKLEPIHEQHGEYELPRSPEAVTKPKDEARKALEGQAAPPFQVSLLDGDMISMEELRGSVVLIDFWATWCGPCRQIMPVLSALQEKYADDGLYVLGISDELTSVVERFITAQSRRGVVYQQAMALESGSVRESYRVKSLPTLYVVDSEGMVRLVHVGAGDMTVVEALVRGLLKLPPATEAPAAP